MLLPATIREASSRVPQAIFSDLSNRRYCFAVGSIRNPNGERDDEQS